MSERVSLNARMKSYEQAGNTRLLPLLPIMARLDGQDAEHGPTD